MSNQTRDLLVEIGTEELPPKALSSLATAFATRLQVIIKDQLDLFEPGKSIVHCYYSPRRLAVLCENLRIQQQERKMERFGPAVDIAFNADGKPNKAAEGFARSVNTTVDKLEQKDGKLFFSAIQEGNLAIDVIPAAIEEALTRLPVPKKMRWGSGNFEFVRPVHWVVVLFGKEVLNCEVLGIRAGRNTYGHRFHHPEQIQLKSPKEYVQTLLDAKVWLNGHDSDLQNQISKQAISKAHEINGDPLNSDSNSSLVIEIASLVEWPVAIRGEFDPKFLSLPEEILIATLEDQQRYFPIRDKNTGKLLPSFITIANIESKNTDKIRQGNERVIIPRLTDAMFFWETDKADSLESRIPALDGIIFQNKLGTIGDKMQRVSRLSEVIAKSVGSDPKLTVRAAHLAKCDLITSLVGEFPELQGIIGKYLAQHDGEPDEIAQAIEEHYLPRFAGDRLPETRTGQALAIADKLDTIYGIFVIGMTPTGEKDPFALKRAALGILRIIIECKLDIDLQQLLKLTANNFDKNIKINTVSKDVFEFMLERLRSYLKEHDYAPDEIDAVLSLEHIQLDRILPRLDAIKMFRSLPEGMALAAANKRIQNILRQAGNGDIYATMPAIDGSLLVEDEEKALCKKLGEITANVQSLTASGNYADALKELAGLRDPVDAFFDKVMVMVNNDKLRLARLQLLAEIHREFQNIADVSRLQG